MRKTFKVVLLVVSLGLLGCFIYALTQALRVRNSASLSCSARLGASNVSDFSYFQIEVKDQHATEPYFDGNIFLNYGNMAGKNPIRVAITRSAVSPYARSMVFEDLQYDNSSTNLLGTKQVDMSFVRLTGSHMNFPFDSANFDFTLSFDPSPVFTTVLIRNSNSSFFIPCERVTVFRNTDNSYRVSFPIQRNPLVVLTAVVLILAASVFLFAIVFFLKSEALPTAIASFFFSLWSIRTILGSEMKTFPTYFDLAILSLCVLLVVSIGIRLSVKEL